LGVIKYEQVHKDRLAVKLRDDLDSAKIVCDNLCFKINENGIDGFLQNPQSNPFGFLLLCDLQV
jgi:hypothetical protein